MRKNNKLYKIIISILVAFLMLSGCQKSQEEDDKLTIVTTLFPQYDFLSRIVEDKAEVVLLMPPGADAHTFEPTPQDITKLSDSDLFVYTSDQMEVYASGIISSVDNADLVVVNIGEYLDLNQADPHFWLDFELAYEIVEHLINVVSELDNDNASFYRDNGSQLLASLKALDDAFWEVVNNSQQDTLVFAGHFAFGYFIERYNLKYISPFKGGSESAEASIKNVKAIVDYLKANAIKSIYFEELADPKLAVMLAEEVEVNILELHAAHNVSKVDFEANKSFIEIMENNLANLKVGLEYAR